MDKGMPLISVIIPVYNVKNYLQQCISSVCRQTYGNLQIILVDDGSIDGSSLICDSFSARDERVQVVHKENGGLVSARKAGVKRAAGKYVAFVDGDDWMDEDAYEKIINLMGQYCGECAPDIIAFGCVEEYGFCQKYKKNKVRGGVYSEKALRQLKKKIFMGENFFEWTILPHLCDKLLKRELLVKSLLDVPDTVSFGEDAACFFPCMEKADSFVSMDVTPYHYRQRSGSIVKQDGELERERFREIYRLLMRKLDGSREIKNQIKCYLFFLLCLKGYSKLEGGTALFPFSKVQRGDSIFVYGAGGFGKVVREYVERSEQIHLCGWTDKKADHYIEQGMKLDRYGALFQREYDKVVISILNENICREVRGELLSQGIPDFKIDFVMGDRIRSAELPSWLEE